MSEISDEEKKNAESVASYGLLLFGGVGVALALDIIARHAPEAAELLGAVLALFIARICYVYIMREKL